MQPTTCGRWEAGTRATGNGTAWKHFSAASEPTGQAGIDLRDVTIVRPGDVWAVGIASFSCGEGQVCPVGDIEHWTGRAWHHVTDGGPVLYGVDAVASNNIYAVGLGIGPAILHYDGASWSKVPSGFDVGLLQAVDAASASDLWAAGSRGAGDSARSLVEHAPSATSGAVVGGSNVGGATISWFGKESGSWWRPILFGDYQVGGLPAGRYTFTATYAGCRPDSARVGITAGTTIGRNFHIDCG